jgi:peptide/nickel transport system substrate-binding protein
MSLVPRCPRLHLVDCLAWLLVGLLIAACQPAAPPASVSSPPAAAGGPATTAAKDTWVVGQGDEPGTLDPPNYWTTADSAIGAHIFDTLVDIQGPDLRMQGIIAERWENLSPTTWRFHLRRGLKAHDGGELTAEDVKYSLELAMDPKSKTHGYATEIASVTVVDPLTVDIVTHEPTASLLVSLSTLFIAPKAARERAGSEAFGTQPIGTGAYKLVSWQRGQQIELEANPDWWRGTPQPRRLIFRLLKDPSTRIAELRTGGVDIVYGIPLPELATLASSPDTQVIQTKGARTISYPFNATKPPFDDLRVRQAMNYAVDREGIVRSILQGNASVLTGPFVPGTLGYDPAQKPWPYDPQKARELLTQAGYANGLEASWTVTDGVFLKDREIAEAVTAQLAAVGIKITLLPTERAKSQADILSGSFALSTSAWGASYDPIRMLSWFYLGEKAALPDVRLPELINRASTELDAAKREQLFREIFRYHVDNALWLYIHAQDELWAKRADVDFQLYPVRGNKGTTLFFKVPQR